jgi:hypothetical protein
MAWTKSCALLTEADKKLERSIYIKTKSKNEK